MTRLRPSARAVLRQGALATAVATTLVSLLPHAAAAQGAPGARDVALPDPRRAFENSWFWGAKGGVARFGTVTEGRVAAPLAGVEWLVTHGRGALLVSAEQTFFDRTSLVVDPSQAEGVRPIGIRDARRYSAAALAAPVTVGALRPYAGVGLGLQVMRRAVPAGEFATQAQYDAVADRVHDGQSIVAAFVVAGAQAQFGRFAAFVQGSAAAAQRRSLWNEGGMAQLEAGLRYNLASAFEK